ncbi:hypothetical protein QR680_017699 [Steinernema hermaphroditum]|uniref:Acyl-CoA thioesterase II domain-containing protein n=1 Tax=Steinernema hermaphroditum TaxID=289476 RepID=A0AA39HFI8_9BILA|nr:hypothetical protein QR680_017699 [Steinernema hermaphroditum]
MSVALEDGRFVGKCFANLFGLEKVSRNAVRNHGPHLGGISKTTRLFGGQTAAQFQLAFRHLFPRRVVHSLRVAYVAPGTLSDPIDYLFEPLKGTSFVLGTAAQKGRTVATAKLRCGPPSDLLDQSPYFMPSLRNPLSYGSVRDRAVFLEDQSATNILQNLIRDSSIFEIRPIDFQLMYSHDVRRPRLFWISLSPLCKALKCARDGPTVVVLLSDCMVVHTARLHFEHLGRHNEVRGAASLNHTIWFHAFEGIDPHGWFLYETRCSRISNTSVLVEGRIYEEKGRCVCTILQEVYINSKI